MKRRLEYFDVTSYGYASCDDLTVIHNIDTDMWRIELETMYEFSTREAEIKYYFDALHAIRNWMIEHDYRLDIAVESWMLFENWFPSIESAFSTFELKIEAMIHHCEDETIPRPNMFDE